MASKSKKKTLRSKIAWSDVKALVLDCDGVLTTGELFYDETGRRMLAFHSRDGFGLGLLCRLGVRVGILSGRAVDIAEKRFSELGVHAFVGKCRDKKQGLLDMCRGLEVPAAQTVYVGDDIPDLEAFTVCGIRVAVADAAPEVLQAADYITQKSGGRGAVREVCELVLKAKGQWFVEK